MDELRKDVVKIIREMAQLDHDPDPSANLISEAGIDSLMALRILASIEKSYGIRIPDEKLMEMTSIEKIASYIAQVKTP